MNCYQCGGVYELKSDSLGIFDFYVGKIEVRGIPYYQCRNCQDILYTEDMSLAIEKDRNKRIHELLIQFPLADFINSTQVSSMLGISRQALHKHRRIKHGFIYQTRFAGMTAYLKQSVLRFKRTGDGRFPLQSHTYSRSTPYIKSTLPFIGSTIHERRRKVPAKPISSFFEQSFLRRKEYSHVT